MTEETHFAGSIGNHACRHLRADESCCGELRASGRAMHVVIACTTIGMTLRKLLCT